MAVVNFNLRIQENGTLCPDSKGNASILEKLDWNKRKQIDDTSRLLSVLLTLLVIVTFAFVIILTNNAFAFALSLHNKTLYDMVNQTLDSAISSKIDVGDGPVAIDINYSTDTIYVVNSGSDTVSVISAENNAKVGEDIPVGKKPTPIAINENTNTIYIANYGSDTVSTDCRPYFSDGTPTFTTKFDIKEWSYDRVHYKINHALKGDPYGPEVSQALFDKFVQVVNDKTYFNKNGEINAIPIIGYHEIKNRW